MQSEDRTKKDIVTEVLMNDIDLPTSSVIYHCEHTHGISVSARSVQRIRKEIKMNNEEDVFDTDENKESKSIADLNQLDNHQINLINLVNEGGWSVQQLSENTVYTVTQIREMIGENGSIKDYVKTDDILDEEDDKVYLYGGAGGVSNATQEILDELDRIDIDNGAVTGVVKNVTNDNDSFWEIEQECISTCGKVEKSIDVFMNTVSRKKAMFYMKWAGAREWLAYLIGEKRENKYYITDLFLPNQCTSSTLVNKVEADNYNQLSIIGVIHSHHEMGAGDEDNPSFSGHDAAFINSNHNLSLLAGRDRSSGGFKIVGIARTVTPCGGFVQIKANVKGYTDDPVEIAWKNEFLEKTMSQPQNNGYKGKNWGNQYKSCGGYNTAVVVNDKRVYKPDDSGVIQTRNGNFHFKK